MQRRDLLVRGAALAAAGLGPRSLGAATKPNIVFIFTDDQAASLMQVMPTVMNLIAARGITFKRAYYNIPLCMPSRTNMLTGRYHQNTGVESNNFSYGTFTSQIEPKTVAVALKNAGYRTGMFGKYINSYNGYNLPVGWTKWFCAAGSTGHFFGPLINEDGRRTRYAADVATTDLISQAAVKFIHASAEAGGPFYAWVSYHAPHMPATPDPEYTGALPGLQAPRTPAFNEADVSDKPAYVRNRNLAGSSLIANVDLHYRMMGRTLLSVQDGVKAIINALEATGQLANTYVIFGADNGWPHLEHRLAGGKGLPYEQVARIPLFMRGPGIPAGISLNHLVSNVDLPATFAQWAGASSFSGVDGRSLIPLFSSTRPSPVAWRTAIPFFYKEGTAGESKTPGWQGIITTSPDYVYVQYSTGEKELYNMATDPYQLSNISKKVPSSLIAGLSSRTRALNSCSGSVCRTTDRAAIT